MLFKENVYGQTTDQGLFSPFWDNDPNPWNWEFYRVNVQNWELFSADLCRIIQYIISI